MLFIRALNFQVSAQRSSFAYSSSMVLEGESSTIPEMLPTVILELQNGSVISIVRSHNYFGALTSSGRLLTWGGYPEGALGREYSCWASGRVCEGGTTGSGPKVRIPARCAMDVRFDRGSVAKERVERYCVAAAAGEWNMAALVIDLTWDEISPEDLEQHFGKTVPHESNRQNSSTRATHYKKTCCLV